MFGLVGDRARWAAVGAVVAVLVGGGGLLTASAAGSPSASSLVPITPCRLLDTRASDVVGPRSTPLGAGTTYTATVWGSNGNCTIPAGATGFSMNVVVINPTAASFLTVFPADKTRPLASSLNWIGGQPPTPNAVTAAASADGKISFYNQFGNVDLAVDIVGYYELSTSGPPGPPGEPGQPGEQGEPGPGGLPPVDRFTPTQIVEGAILTCTTTDAIEPWTECAGPKLNGVAIRTGAAQAAAICNVVTGSEPAGWGGGGSTTPYFAWDGSTWALASDNGQPFSFIQCQY